RHRRDPRVGRRGGRLLARLREPDRRHGLDRLVGQPAIASARSPLRRPGPVLPARGVRGVRRLSRPARLRRRGHRPEAETGRPPERPSRENGDLAPPIQGNRRGPPGATKLARPRGLFRWRLSGEARTLVPREALTDTTPVAT